MPGLSIHVVDVSRGVVASGMRVEVHELAAHSLLCDRLTTEQGLVDDPRLAGPLPPGYYQASFHVADYYRALGLALPSRPFLDVVRFQFGIDDPQQHYHLPLKLTPWGLSCFRGGA